MVFVSQSKLSTEIEAIYLALQIEVSGCRQVLAINLAAETSNFQDKKI
jgi:hypothetical protein